MPQRIMNGARVILSAPALDFPARMNPDNTNQRPIEAGVITDLGDRLSYGGYLHLERLLSEHHPLSRTPHHDEMLFIVQHQVADLWNKLMIQELRAATVFLRNDHVCQ